MGKAAAVDTDLLDMLTAPTVRPCPVAARFEPKQLAAIDEAIARGAKGTTIRQRMMAAGYDDMPAAETFRKHAAGGCSCRSK